MNPEHARIEGLRERQELQQAKARGMSSKVLRFYGLIELAGLMGLIGLAGFMGVVGFRIHGGRFIEEGSGF